MSRFRSSVDLVLVTRVLTAGVHFDEVVLAVTRRSSFGSLMDRVEIEAAHQHDLKDVPVAEALSDIHPTVGASAPKPVDQHAVDQVTEVSRCFLTPAQLAATAYRLAVIGCLSHAHINS